MLPYTQRFKINVSRIDLFAIKDGGIIGRNIANIDLDNFSEERLVSLTKDGENALKFLYRHPHTTAQF